jgi:hypothetical protein
MSGFISLVAGAIVGIYYTDKYNVRKNIIDQDTIFKVIFKNAIFIFFLIIILDSEIFYNIIIEIYFTEVIAFIALVSGIILFNLEYKKAYKKSKK